MSSTRKRRVILYCGGGLVSIVLVVLGFVLPSLVDADPGTLLGMAEMHLGMAQLLPEKDKSGKPVPFRDEHLAKAKDVLDRVEGSSPGLTITREFRAFHAWISGDMGAAVRWYREVLELASDDEALRNKTLMNLAQVECVRGGHDTAMKHLDAVPERKRDGRWYLLSAQVCHGKGDKTGRAQALRRALDAAKDEPSQIRTVADQAFEFGDDIALSVYERLDKKPPGIWYRIARLKIASGDLDSARDALNHVRKENPVLLNKLMAKDREVWESHGIQGHPSDSSRGERGKDGN